MTVSRFWAGLRASMAPPRTPNLLELARDLTRHPAHAFAAFADDDGKTQPVPRFCGEHGRMRHARAVLTRERGGKPCERALAQLLDGHDRAHAPALRRGVGAIPLREIAHEALGLAQHARHNARFLPA